MRGTVASDHRKVFGKSQRRRRARVGAEYLHASNNSCCTLYSAIKAGLIPVHRGHFANSGDRGFDRSHHSIWAALVKSGADSQP